MWFDMTRATISAVMASLLTAGLPTSALAQASPSYSGFTISQCIPFAKTKAAVNDVKSQVQPFTYAPSLSFKITGKDTVYTVQMDTGSVGLVMSSRLIPKFDQLARQPSATPGWQFLSSSKILWTGTWVKVPITLLKEGRVPIATAEVPVLGVQQTTQCPWYKATDQGTCPARPADIREKPDVGIMRSTKQLKPIVYMGVGFGQEADFQPQGTPDKNILLNLTSIGGKPVDPKAIRRGYIIGMRGITVGLTPANTTDFKFIKLNRYCDPNAQSAGTSCPTTLASDWQSPAMCVSVNGQACVNGQLLVDTGIPQSYLDVPQQVMYETMAAKNPSTKQITKVLKTGTEIIISLPDAVKPVVTTGFTVGAGETIEPLHVIPWSWERSSAFLNTGRYFLRGWQFLYDADQGYVGLKPSADSCGG